MTREEAIKIIKECKEKKFKYTLYTLNEYHAAMEMAINALENENAVIDCVLEIIDSEAWSYCDYIVKHENGNRDKQGAASHLADNIREAVLALKGGEQG